MVSTSALQLGRSGAGESERKERKRIQNRLNQRARRFRNREENAPVNSKARLYQVHRWRVEDGASHSHATQGWSSKPRSELRRNSEQSISEPAGPPALCISVLFSDQSLETRFPLPADQLLHLINYNVFRALYMNKAILGQVAMSLKPGHEVPETFHGANSVVFPEYSVILPLEEPVASSLPACLAPTESQMSLIHSTWIDLLPFPKMRENLINWGTCFDHAEFVKDLIGNLLDERNFYSPWFPQKSAGAGKLTLSNEEDDEVTATRNGLIIWGEPYKMESWEATPGFLKKWTWAVEGCEGLIVSSNRWRIMRGEDPMQLSA
ncbi:hypothetical protein ASPWEDRAFT_26949 [Aspergillus wentii DTO 134E9]|uniref:BZIP domain-containing protein n=1 Tax=Aspergillus wentii DTO 134E9 TaxID=1073089 RepID=A0A1L9RRL9_ASPWE|nr:uncharacterized protein ASPWEDRAFT_26949 [Aspergillus wentii DTO 134E9]KAI9930421.1 hypothetical protein MW887_011175 [Aspergillus wentii]OJJ37581.1 hypothetical protein ASPWEDRAFT_26949 [Aspergillus wentii DTO 134E9]